MSDCILFPAPMFRIPGRITYCFRPPATVAIEGAVVRKHLLAAIFLAALLLCVAVAGCGRGPSPCPSQQRVLQAFSAVAAPKDSVTGNLQFDLYIDDSQSVAGFVAGGSSSYLEVMEKLLRHSETAGYTRQVYRVSDPSAPVRDLTRGIILNSSFYTGKETPLRRLLDVIRKRNAPGRIALVVSDLVQSENLEDQQSLVESLRLLASPDSKTSDKLQISLLAFKSQFRGSYYSETSRGLSYPLSISGARPGTGRPFYLLVIASSQATLEAFQKYVLRGIGEEAVFAPSKPAFDITSVKFSPDNQPKRTMWNSMKDPEMFPAGSESPRGFRVAFMEGEAIKPGTAELRLQCALKSSLPIIALDQIQYKMEIVSFVKERQRATPQPANGRVTFGDSLANGRLRINYAIDVPEPQTWDVYRVQLSPGAGNLGVPEWVEAWSTESDVNPSQGNRTLHFSQFVETLVRAVTERVRASDQYVLIGSRR
jgi:hypothetical protein